MTGTSFMAKEISGQPKLWKDTFESILRIKDRLNCFLEEIYKISNLQIVLTGAGSSAFIGSILKNSFERNTGLPIMAVPTTDFVTHPGNFFPPTLLISFARSGDSPESVATFQLAEKLNPVIYHLIITCNPEGKLVRLASGKRNSFIFLLPEDANDQALAMTSSFTSMALAGLLISDLRNIENNRENVKRLIDFGNVILERYETDLIRLADKDFKRIVFLGSGPLKGIAQESHLKVVELTDGQIICQYDSFLGFRHGPKAIIDESTLLVYLFSNDPYVHKYEVDLVKSIYQNDNYFAAIGIRQCSGKSDNLDLDINLSSCGNPVSDDFFAICSVIPAQILGYYKSLSLGLTPDSPSKKGGIHRIVQGVTIYPY